VLHDVCKGHILSHEPWASGYRPPDAKPAIGALQGGTYNFAQAFFNNTKEVTMSDNHHASGHDAHAAPTPSAAKKVFNVVVLLGLPLIVVGTLVSFYKSHDSAPAGSMSEEAVTARIQKVGMLQLGEAKHELKTGEEVFKAQCTTCHTAGMLGAPKFGDAAAWGPRIATGYAALLNSALKGKNAMTAQGGGAFSDYEVGRAVVYMANAGGAKFAEPKAPEGAAAPATAPAEAVSAAK
jgi:cytochrome c5